MKLQAQRIRYILIGVFSLALLFTAYGENETPAKEQATPKPVNQQTKVAVTSSGGMGGQVVSGTGGGMGMGGGGMMGGFAVSGMATPPAAESSSVLIIPRRQQDPQAIAEIMEDGKIMSQIIGDSIPPAQAQSPFKGYIGNALYGVFGSAGLLSCVYIEQYGIIFVRQVDYPLLPSGKIEAQPQQDKDTDKVWQKAKRTVEGEAVLDENGQNTQPSYDPGRVEQLKQNLIGSLKHASNIRRLKPDDYIVIAIRYCPPPRRDTYPKRPALLDLTKESQQMESSVTPSSSMVIRAAKKDIDQFADEKINDAEFEKRVEVIVY